MTIDIISPKAEQVKIVLKTYAVETKNADPKTGIVDVFIPLSTESVDRDEEIVPSKAFLKRIEHFKKRPILVSSHEYRGLTNQIGEFIEFEIRENGIFGKPKYYVNLGNKEADWGFFLASIGMASYSIGFLPYEWEDFPKSGKITVARKRYLDVELLECSHIIVPSNRDSAQNMRTLSVSKGILPPDDIEKIIDNLITKPEETEDFFRVPVQGEGGDKHKGHRIRTIDISAKEGISALYCGECKVVITYLFDKKHDWTMAKAEAWVKEHEKSLSDRHYSQAEIKDEVDYLIKMLDEAGLGDENKPLAQILVRRISGSDMPVDYKAAIREMVAPIIEILDEHHGAHQKYYKGCRKALESMCGEKQESLADYLQEEIKRQMEVIKNARNID